MDTDFGVQKFHSHPTPRIGGIGIYLGVLAGAWFCVGKVSETTYMLALAGVPAFFFGLAEDLTKRVGVGVRLLATMASGILGWRLTGAVLADVNVWGLDQLLSVPLFAVFFTAFAVGGVANALNIIDGFNGLASGSAIILLLAMAALALGAGDPELAAVCFVLAGAVAGFFLVNWPWGKLFLGDGGAYFVGFSLAWVAVLLLWRHPHISAWAPLLVCAYPVLEVGFSIWRRRKRQLNPGHPDRLHLHSLVKRRVVRRWIPRASNLTRNSLTGALMWAFAAVPAVLALQWPTRTSALVLGFLVCAFGYSAAYARLTQFRWCFRAHTLRARRSAVH
ncbi:MAG: MraY family glycosyltransferase [Rhodoferax sp.]